MRVVEIHVLAGHASADLRVDHLEFIVRDPQQGTIVKSAKDYLAANADVTLSFTIANASAAPGASTRSFEATHGIKLNKASGVVTAPATLTDPFPHNFLLEVDAKGGTDTFRELIRIHVHREIKDLWLTPGTLTVRATRGAALPQQTSFRFALRARFDDDTVGDITDWDGTQWGPAGQVEAGSGNLIVRAADAGKPPFTITVALPGFTTKTASGKMRVEAPWDPATPIDARLVAGGGSPTPATLNLRPNVLFLPDGFASTDKDVFFRYVSSLVAGMSDSHYHPYSLLAGSMNFWAAFLPSSGASTQITWASEVFILYPGAPGVQVRAVPAAVRPQDHATRDWDVGDLLYEVGLPLPTDASTNTARTNLKIQQEWQTLFGSKVDLKLPRNDVFRKMAIDGWRALATRRLLDDIDTPLGVTAGAVRPDVLSLVSGLNPDRVDRTLMNDLLSALRHDKLATSGLQIGALWTDTLKRDFDLVILVTVGPGRMANHDGFLIISQGKDSAKGTLSGVNDITLSAYTVSDRPDPDWQRTFVHELSHSFDLGDEYPQNGAPLFPARQDRVDRVYPNLATPRALNRANKLHGEEIKWRWPRIRWAAEINGPITKVGNTFQVPVLAAKTDKFPIGEVVHLRVRDIHIARKNQAFDQERTSLVKLPPVSVAMRLKEVTESGTPPVLLAKLEVDAAAPFEYPASALIDANQVVATFVPGCIVYCPVVAPVGAIDGKKYPYAELIAKNVRDLITSTAAPVATRGSELANFGTMAFPPKFSNLQQPRVVALYEGGTGNETGAYHPTADCTMIHGGVSFCGVCAYALVDAIDPARHGAFDAVYAKIYPQE